MKPSDTFYQELFNNAVMGIYYSTPQGRHLEVNPALTAIYGYDDPDTLLRQLVDIDSQLYVEPGRRSLFLEALERCGEIHNFESQVYRCDGRIIWISENARAVCDERGRALYYVGTVKDITERKESEVKLLQYQEELRALAEQLSLSEEKERRRISTELHDSVGQILALLKMKLGAAKRDAGGSLLETPLEEIGQLAESALSATRALMFEISPPMLYEMGFEPAISWLAEHFTTRHGLPVHFEASGCFGGLSEDLKVMLYQAVRELLMNVVKHAGANQASVRLSQDDQGIHLEVGDNGKGLKAVPEWTLTEDYSGFGLFNIRERLHHLGGRFSLANGESEGCRVKLFIPNHLLRGPAHESSH